MTSRRFILFVAACLVGIGTSLSGAGRVALADPTIAGYRFLPRLSILNEQGGIYPRDIDYRVLGTFDFVTQAADVVHGKRASFDNVNAWASHPILAYVLPLDQKLNLSELNGRQLPVGAPFDVFQFSGTTQDGSSVRLVAAQIGPWLRMHGETTPPVGGADMLSYRLRAVARRTPTADINDDGIVNAADLPRSPLTGSSFLEWQRQLGETPPSFEAIDATLSAALAASVTASAATVPEPGILALVGLATVALVRTGRGRRGA